MTLQMVNNWYRQFGGLFLIREYAKEGVLWIGIKSFFRWIIGRESFKGIFLSMLRKVEVFLEEKYKMVMLERKEFYSDNPWPHNRNKFVWICWLQGLERAPEIIKVCYASLLRHFPDREVKVIDDSNWAEFVSLPEYVIGRWKNKQISPANFSDLLRLELLIRYGGTWIDATVLCTGKDHTEEYLNSDLFMFQYTRPGSDEWGGIGNWFISSCTNNEVLMVLRDMLYAYWRDYDCTLDYYIFHLFFSMLREVYPEEIAAMPYGYAARHISLAKHWGETFDREKWDKLVSKVSFHKLTHVISKRTKADPENYYNWILKNC